jgi:ABC-type Fe3+-siderophore transport system permease subunit
MLSIKLNVLYIYFIDPISYLKENIMSYKVLFVLNAVVAFAFGLFLFLVPSMALSQFTMDGRVPEVFLTRVVGVALTSLGLLLWFAKDSDESSQKNLGIASLVGVVLALIVTIMGVASGVVRTNGWIAIVVEIVFGLGYAFMLFLKPQMKE